MEELDELEGIILAGMLLIAAYIVTRIRLIKVVYKGGDKKFYFHLQLCPLCQCHLFSFEYMRWLE